MSWAVTTEKNNDSRACMAVRAPDRYKCGHCRRGVVLTFSHYSAAFKMMNECKCCGAKVHATYIVPWASEQTRQVPSKAEK